MASFNTIGNYLSADRTSRNEQLIIRLHQIVRDNFTDFDFSLAAAAQILGMNASYISHIFKKQTGESFVDYLNQIRIEHACSLLKGTEEPITNVATQSGFFSAGYFSSIFKKIIGCTPGQYRSI